VLLFVAPIFVGWLAVRIVAWAFYRPEGWVGTTFWIAQAVVVASVAAHSARRVANTLAPMSTLLNMTMVFPDHAPSRFGVTLRAGNIKKLTPEQLTLSDDTQEAAEQAMAMVAALGVHEPRTRGHTERVRAYAELIGQEMGLTDDELNRLRWGVLLHDVGKLKVPAHILNSKEAPTEEQWAILKQHPLEGQKILKPLQGWLGDWAFVSLHHHERWDGGGYPAQLEGTESSLGGRIGAVADAYDVITSKRAYKEAMSPRAAREELYRRAGSQFDPAVVKAFLRVGLEDRRRSAGFLGWLFELPTMVRVTSSVATASPSVVSAMATAATALSVSIASVVGVGSVDAPTALAFDDSRPVIEEAVVGDLAIGPIVPPLAPVATSTAATTALLLVQTTSGPPTSTPFTATTLAPSPTSSTTPTPTSTAAPTTTSTAAPTTTTTTTAAPTTTTTAPPWLDPAANDDTITITGGGDKSIRVLDNDTPGEDPIDDATLEIIVAPIYADQYRVHDDHIHYKPGVQDVVDTIVYQICDTKGRCEEATVTVILPE